MPRRIVLASVLGLAVCASSSLMVPDAGLGTALAQSASAPEAAPGGPPPASGVAPRQRPTGYLGPDRLPDHAICLPPPPEAGSALAVADVAIFAATRELQSGPRWQLATSDDHIDRKSMLGAFSCALGVDLAAIEIPALTRVLTRSGADLFPVIGAAKDKYLRPRPFVTEQGPVCITPSEDFAKSGSYPSGHAASGWLHALLLAEIDPIHAAGIVNRGRAFGESRVVCGVHYLSDVEAGRLTASALVAALHGAPEFETDVAAARAELTTLRAANAVSPPAVAACDTEQANLATPW